MNLWNIPGVPHKGWEVVSVIDLRGDDPNADYESCEMCGHERVRFVHMMKHPEFPNPLRVGSVCAGKMCEGYNASGRESDLKNRAGRRKRWLNRWGWSKKGNPYRKEGDHYLVIVPDKFHPGKYKYSIDGSFSPETFDSIMAAQLATFDKLWPRN